MPVKIPNTLPAREILERENIFVMDEERAMHQDIRPLRVAILNLMPTKIATTFPTDHQRSIYLVLDSKTPTLWQTASRGVLTAGSTALREALARPP